jgi:Putative glycolipid-binding
MRNRKGIFQEFDTTGRVLADERWQVIEAGDGSLIIENETVRVAPFDEPRSDSMTCVLAPDGRYLDFSIHGLLGRRESRVCVLGEARQEATVCWRFDGVVNERRFAWREDLDLDWNSPLLNMITVRRSQLSAGRSRRFDVLFLDPTTFAPSWMTQVYTNHGQERHETRFGSLNLWAYSMDFGGDGQRTTRMWFDDEGVLYDFRGASGGFVLTATDV